MASIAVRPPAGTGATAALQVQPDGALAGLRGRIRLVSGSASLAAGALAVVTLDVQPVADLDAQQAAQGLSNGGVFSTVDILLTPWDAPPAGATFLVIAQFAQGLLTGFALGVTAALTASTVYRFGWRVFA